MKKILLSVLLIVSVYYGQGKISGVTYFDYTYDLSECANDDGFSLNRAYFTYEQELSKGISYKFQTDVGQLEVFDSFLDDVVTTQKTQYVAYLKNAKVDWVLPGDLFGKVTIGLQGMNIFNVTEKTWGFRFLQKSAMDKYKFSSSADMGIGYSGDLSNYNLHYSVMYTNGSGYKNSENDKHKKISTQIVYGEKKLVKKDGINLGTSFSIEPYDTEADGGNSTTKNKTVMAFFGGYAGNGLRLGGEFDVHTDAGTDVTQQIIAAYASYKISDKFEALVWLDMYDQDIDTSNNAATDLIIATNYHPGKGLTISPNIRINLPEEGDSSTQFMMNFEFKF